MSAPAETTAAMIPPAESEGSPVAVPDAVPVPGSAAPAVASRGTQTGRDARLAREPVSSTVVIGVLGGLMTALVGVLGALLVWQLSAIGDSIDNLGTELRSEISSPRDEQRSELRSEIGGLRDEFRSELRSEIGGLRDEFRSELRSEIGGLRDEFRSEIGGLRAEMQAGFRQINTTLLDHTDRLARLEAAVGLTRADESSTVAPAADDE